MNRRLELERADRELSEVSSKIESLRFHLTSLESNIALLSNLKEQFYQNISILKSDKIVTAMAEYRKIKEELQTANNRIYAMRIDFNNHQVILERTEKLLFMLRENYVILLRGQDGKVIKGTFGGQK